MEWIINQLRVHPELAIFLTLFAGFWLGRHLIDNAVKYSKEEAELSISCRILAGQTQNREILIRDSHQCSAGRRVGRATEYHCGWPDESCVLSAFPVCRRL